MNKEQQKQLITEIMHLDTKDGLYEDKIKVRIKKDSEAAKTFESLRKDKQNFKDELKRVHELAEKSWEGCDGCDENDKNFWMNGFQKGYYSAKPDVISDEEIEKAAKKCRFEDLDISVGSFELGAKWYREQLKHRQ